MKKIIKKWLCFCVSICMILSVSTNVLAADSRAYQGLNSKVFATDYLTEEEIQEILNNDSAASYSSVQLIPYLRFTVTDSGLYSNHIAELANISSNNKVAKDAVIVQNVYYTTSKGEQKQHAVQRKVGTLYPGQAVREVFGGLAVYYHIDKIAYFAFTMHPTLSITNTIWIY